MRRVSTTKLILPFLPLRNHLFWLLRWCVHPTFIFIAIQLVWLSITLLWVLWFIEEVRVIADLATKLDINSVSQQYSLLTMIAGCILLIVLLVGTFFLFLFGEKQRKLNQQQKHFLSSVTHELRSPLASLQLCFETLKTRDLDEATKGKLLSMSALDVERLSRNVNQILLSAQLDRGINAFAEEKETIDLSLFLESLLHNHKSEKQFKLRTVPGLKVNLPKSPLTLIFSNLIDNALKYSPENSKIHIVVKDYESFVKVAVTDQGIGLDPKEVRKIFRMFYRSPNVSKKAIKGSGLGLFIVSSMVKYLGGQVWAKSKGPGTGSTFTVLLPLSLKESFFISLISKLKNRSL